MSYRATLRYGDRYQRYHTMDVDADDSRAALRAVAEAIPDEIAGQVDLVEVRRRVEPEERAYLGEDVTPEGAAAAAKDSVASRGGGDTPADPTP